MSRAFLRVVVVFLFAVVAAFGKMPNAPLGADLFTNGPVLHLKIELPPPAVESLRREPRKAVAATVREGSQVFSNVAVHLKGALGSFRPIDDKPGLVLNFSKLNSGQRFHGLHKFMLNNSVQDPSYLNECLAGELFRAAGVPAPRTCHAMVEINGETRGLYVLKEGLDKDFLGLWFKKTGGNFYDINQGFYDLGAENDLKDRFRLDSGNGPTNKADLAALIKAVQEKDPAKAWEKLDAILETDRFISFMAMEMITCHIDGYSTYGHNIRIYNNPKTEKLVFIPNDMDRMFTKPELPVLRANFTAQASSAIVRAPEGRRRYAERARYLMSQVFNLPKLTNQVSLLRDRILPELKTWNASTARDCEDNIRTVNVRLVRRAEFLKQELEQAERK